MAVVAARLNAIEKARFDEMIEQYQSEAEDEHIGQCSPDGNSWPGCAKALLVSALVRYIRTISQFVE